MPFLTEIELHEGRLLLWEISETSEELLQLEAGFAQDDRFREISNEKRRKEWLATRLLIQLAGCSQQQLSYTENDKPIICHPLYRSVSISHSGKLAGVLLHQHENCGLDIESINRDFRRVEAKYLTAEESALAANTPHGLALFWCIKEAVYKSAGIPGLSFSQQIRISRSKKGKIEVLLMKEPAVRYSIFDLKHAEQLLVYCIPA